ncbi:MAG: AraC family transcriptional regulator [Spirochaetes bacterium]|nr:AraC family transcriptional regulator [Spirochaetota bacterium]
MNYQIRKPCRILSRYVKYYWILEDCQDYPCHNPFRVIPNGMTEMLFHFGGSYYCYTKGNILQKQPFISLCGMKNTFFDVVAPSTTGFLSVVFKPYGSGVFFPFHFMEILNSSIDIENVYSNVSDRLYTQISENKNVEKKIQYVENFLISCLKPEKRPNFDLIEKMFLMIDDYNGLLNIDTLRKEFDVNFKFIERLFMEFLGITPKAFLKIIRFQSAICRYSYNKTDLTTLAYNSGYFDQAHFNKDIRKYTGCNPKQFFKDPYLYSDYFMK